MNNKYDPKGIFASLSIFSIELSFCLLTVLFFQLFLFLLFPSSRFGSIIIGFLAIAGSFFPLVRFLFLKRYILIVSSFSAFTFSPIWFLYLEGVSPNGDALLLLSPELRSKAYILSVLFLFVFSLVYSGLVKLRLRLVPLPFYPNLKRLNLEILTIFFFIAPIILIGYFQHGGSYQETWLSLVKGRVGGEGMGVLLRVSWKGDESVYLQPLIWIFKLVPLFSACTMCFKRASTSLVTPFAILSGIFVSFFYFLGGSRGEFILVIGPALLVLLSNSLVTGKHIFKTFVLSLLSLLLVLNLFQLQYAYRGNILDKLTSDQAIDVLSQASFGANSQRDNNLYFASIVFDRINTLNEPDGYSLLLINLLNPIPRALWPNKPHIHDLDDNLLKVLGSGPLTLGTPSLTISLPAEFFFMDGYLGLLLGSTLMGMLVSYFDRVSFSVITQKPLGITVASILFGLSLWSFRSVAIIGLGYPAILLLLSGLIFRTLKSLLKNPATSPKVKQLPTR